MRHATVLFHREHALLKKLLSLRRLERGWARAAARFVERFPTGEAVELHVYLEARCDQSCEFCAQPVQREHASLNALARLDNAVDRAAGDLVRSGAFEALLDACALRDAPVSLTLTGHDWLAHPARDALLEILARRPRLALRLQGPSTALADRSLAERVAALPSLVAVSLTAQSGEARDHDRMVGRAGAFDALCAAVARLIALGVPIEVNTVLTRDGLRALPSTLGWLAERGLRGSLAAFVPEPMLPWPAPLFPRLQALREAFARHEAELVDRSSSLVGFPLCVLPARLSDRAYATARSTSPGARACASCAENSRCPGLPAEYLAAFGEGELTPFTSPK